MAILSQFSRPHALLKLTILIAVVIVAATPASSSATAVQAPPSAPGDPIYVVGLKQDGMPGKDYAGLLSDRLRGLIANKFPCTTTTAPDDVAVALGWAKDQQLLGTPEEQQIQLQNIAAAMGNVGVLVTGSFGQTDSGYYVNIVTINANTSKMTGNTMVTASGDSDELLFDLVERAVSQMDLKPCRPAWTGRITMTDTMDDFFVKKVGTTTKMAMGLRRDVTTLELKPGLVSSPDNLMATISRSMDVKRVDYELNEATSDCAAGGWHTIAGHVPEWVKDPTEKNFRWSAEGQWSVDVPVRVTLSANGHYKISWDVPQLTREEEVYDSYTHSPDVCKGAALVTKENTVRSTSPLSWKVTIVEGDIDRSRQDTLTGLKEARTPLTSAYPEDWKTGNETLTTVWSLRRPGSR